jgi:hypothetical protein
VSIGRKERHACNVIGTCSNREMESSCAGALPAREPENIEAAGNAKERETNAFDPLAAPEVTGRWETNAPCLKETAKSMGAQETNEPPFPASSCRISVSTKDLQRRADPAQYKPTPLSGEPTGRGKQI